MIHRTNPILALNSSSKPILNYQIDIELVTNQKTFGKQTKNGMCLQIKKRD